MEFKTVASLYDSLKGAVSGTGADAKVLDEKVLRGKAIDEIVYNAVFNANKAVLEESRRLIKALAGSLGIRSASIHDLY